MAATTKTPPAHVGPWLLALVLIVSACGGPLPRTSYPPTASRSTTTTALSTKTSATTTTAAASAQATTAPALPANISYNTSAIATYAVGPQPSNWDIHSALAARWYATLSQVLAQVWPSVFQPGPGGVTVLNTSLVTSVQQTGQSSLVYHINPDAVWSDGVPVTYRDFVYNWRAQSGRATWRDVDGKRFRPMSYSGYNDISAVEGNPADPYTVTVKFGRACPDWRSLFAYLVPAHVAQAVGFDSGFSAPVGDLVSAGPYLVSELQPGYSLQLVRNARYWGSPGNLASITYYFTSGAPEALDALSAGELDVTALQVPASNYQQLQVTSGLSVQAVASSEYEDLDFNEKRGPMRGEALRRAVMMVVDRGAMASSVFAPYGIDAGPVENRVYLPGTAGYASDGSSYDKPLPAGALQLLGANGYRHSGGALYGPGGARAHVSLYVSSSDPLGLQLASQVSSACAGIGIEVSVVEGASMPGDIDGTERAEPPPGRWDMAIERRYVPFWPSAIGSRYATGGLADVGGYSSSAMDGLLSSSATTPRAGLSALYDRVDSLAWQDAADLPLVQVPVIVAVNSKLLNVEIGPWDDMLAWDEQDWGFRA